MVVDVTSVHQPGMAYVMLSRVQSIEQLHIIEKLDPLKITVNDKVIKEARRMNRVSINQNPCDWMKNTETPKLKVCSFNTCSLRKHIEDIRTDLVLMQSDILFVEETWLEEEEEEEERYQLEGYRAHFTSRGRGKGIVAYIKQGVRSMITKYGEPNLQLTKVSMKKLDVIGTYRSRDEPLSQLTWHLRQFINPEKDTLIVGDVNICATKKNDLGKFLEQEGFCQLVTLPTHIGGGIHFLNCQVLHLPKYCPFRCH